jgi:clan AA aspartic protease
MNRIKLTNSADVANARAGALRLDQVRTLEVEALVDTGATMLALPADLVAALGLLEMDRRKVKLADGSVHEMSRVGDLRFEILGRDMTCDALVMPAGSTPLIGQLQLEALDLIVDAKSRQVMVNPASPDMPLLDLLRAS